MQSAVSLGIMLVMATNTKELVIETKGPCEEPGEDFGLYAGYILYRGRRLVSTWAEFISPEAAQTAMKKLIGEAVSFYNQDPC